jgi:hypothetical protein
MSTRPNTRRSDLSTTTQTPQRFSCPSSHPPVRSDQGRAGMSRAWPSCTWKLLRSFISWIRATASPIGRLGSCEAATSERVWPAETVVAWSTCSPAASTEPARTRAKPATVRTVISAMTIRPRWVRRTAVGHEERTSAPVRAPPSRTTRPSEATRRKGGRPVRGGIPTGWGASPLTAPADMASSGDVRFLTSIEQASDRTSVRCLTRAAEEVETRVEQVFETRVRSA